MNTVNIDLDLNVFDELRSYLTTQVEEDPTQLFLFHQRKRTMTDVEQEASILETIKLEIENLQRQSISINTVYLLDCCGAMTCVHSDNLLLAEVTALLSQILDPDASADIVLVDYIEPVEKDDQFILRDISLRNIFDPSVVEDSTVQAFQELERSNPDFQLEADKVTEENIKLIVENVILQLQNDEYAEPVQQ